MCTCPQCCSCCADEVDPGWPNGSYPMQERDEPCCVKHDDVMNERM